LIVYLNSFHTSFHFDDYFAITGNEAVREAGNLSKNFWLYPGRFLLIYSFTLNYFIHGADPVGYHVANFLFHLGSAIFLFFCALAIFRSQEEESGAPVLFIAPALFVALLFAAHPIMTESVTYISGRTSSLAGLFYLGTLSLYTAAFLGKQMDAGGGGRRTAFYAASVVLFFLSLWVKESNATLPLILLALDFYFVERGHWRRLLNSVLRAAPFFLILTGILLWRKVYVGAIGEARPLRSMTVNLLTQFRVVVEYIRLLFIPVNQNIDHDVALAHSLLEPPTLLAFLLLLLIGLAALLLFKKSKIASFGIIWFFVNLAPTSSVIPLWDLMSERWLYIPSIGAFLVAGGALAKVYKLGRSREALRKLASASAVAVVCAFSVLTIARNTVWKNEYTLWRDAVEKSPRKARPHNNLAMALAEKGDLEGALREAHAALSLEPESPETSFNLASLYLQLGRYDEAIVLLRHTLARFPSSGIPPRLADDFAKAHFNLGSAYLYKGDYEQAIAEYRKSLELAPYLPWAHSNMGVAYEMLGDYRLAIAEFEKEFALNPSPQVGRNLENARQKLKDKAE
jgi:tetratricopeptide (TPR) repeat protein